MGLSFCNASGLQLRMWRLNLSAVLHFLPLLAPLLIAARATPARPRQPHSPSQAFVHLFEWSWPDIAKECEDWLGPKGFAAVQVSPVAEHIRGSAWWTRYQPVSYNLTSRSGDRHAFADMVQRCRAAGVSIYVDVVFNHCAFGSGVGIAGSTFGARKYPLFGPEDFHHDTADMLSNCAVSDYLDPHNVQFCDLLGMPDLCTECEGVQTKVAAFLDDLAALGVDGLRIDAAKHMEAGALGQLFSRATKGGDQLFRYAEVSHSPSGDAIQPEAYLGLGAVTEFSYPAQVDESFVEPRRLAGLDGFGEEWGLVPSGGAVVFVDNHDTQRDTGPGGAKLTYKDGKLYELASIFMLAHPYGYPQVMSSFRFEGFDDGPPSEPVHDPTGQRGPLCGDAAPWVCEHRWPAIANMVSWRRTAGDAPISHFQSPSDDFIAFCRGAVACIALNRQETGDWEAELRLPLAPGEYCDVTQSDESGCRVVRVSRSGYTTVRVPALGAVAIHTGAKASSVARVTDKKVSLRRGTGASARRTHTSSFLITADAGQT